MPRPFRQQSDSATPGQRLIDTARQMKNGAVVRSARALPGAARFHLLARGGRVPLFDVCARIGMGGMLTHAVRLLTLGEANGRAVDIRFTNPLYGRTPGEDWLPELFDRVEPIPAGAPRLVLPVRNERDYELLSTRTTPGLAQARALFHRHLRFSNAANAEHGAARAALPDLSRTIGVHYRGTDKSLEARRPAAEAALEAVLEMHRLTDWREVLVATDEPAFADWLRDQLPGLTLHEYARPDPGVGPVHFADGDGIRKGLEAVTLIRLLSECGVLVRSASYLSAWAQILSPRMPVLLLDAQALYQPLFPERELLASASWARIGGPISASAA